MRINRGFWTTAGATALILLPTQVVGQDLEAACVALGSGPVGSWTEQRVSTESGIIDYRFALVTSRGATWYEIAATNAQGTSIL